MRRQLPAAKARCAWLGHQGLHDPSLCDEQLSRRTLSEKTICKTFATRFSNSSIGDSLQRRSVKTDLVFAICSVWKQPTAGPDARWFSYDCTTFVSGSALMSKKGGKDV